MSVVRHDPRPGFLAMRRVVAVALLGLASASCARGPQVVFISPQLAGPPDRIAAQPRVELSVKDTRTDKVVGSRGGTVDQLATITTNEDVTPALAEALEQKLEEQGYDVVAPGQGGEVRLAVELQELTYETGGSVLTEIRVSSAVGATTTKGTVTLTSRYRTNHREEYASAPSEKENSELLNMVVGKSLEQLLADTELRDFMTH